MEISWEEIERGCKYLYKKLPKNKYEGVICIATGGLVPGKILSELLDLPLGIVLSKRYEGKKVIEDWMIDTNIKWGIRKFHPKSILLVDDIVDKGKTINRVLQNFRNYTAFESVDIAVLFDKRKDEGEMGLKNRLIFWKKTEDWIKFPWEKM